MTPFVTALLENSPDSRRECVQAFGHQGINRFVVEQDGIEMIEVFAVDICSICLGVSKGPVGFKGIFFPVVEVSRVTKDEFPVSISKLPIFFTSVVTVCCI